MPLSEIVCASLTYRTLRFGNLVNSSLATLNVTSLYHVTEVLSLVFDAGTLVYEINVTSLTYMVDTSASNDVATGLKVNRKAAPAISLCGRQLPRVRK